MGSFRVATLIAASIFLLLPVPEASACSCRRSTAKEQFAEAELVIRGRMRTVTYGNVMPNTGLNDEISRAARGEIEVERVLKGTLKEKTVSVYTGTGMGDCGLLGIFLGTAVYYNHEKFGVLELALMKSEYAGQTFYSANICEYVKGPKDDEGE